MRHLIEKLEDITEAKKPYTPASYEARQAVEADLHEAVAKAARDVLRSVTLLHQVVAKAADKTGAGTFQETRDQLWKVDIVEIMEQLAKDHTRWSRSIRAGFGGGGK